MIFFFFNDTATTEIYTLSLHDALPISTTASSTTWCPSSTRPTTRTTSTSCPRDRKSTRLNSSHSSISYAVFCLKKKKKTSKTLTSRTLLANFAHVAQLPLRHPPLPYSL